MKKVPDFWFKLVELEKEVRIMTDDPKVEDGIVLRFPFDEFMGEVLGDVERHIEDFKSGRLNHRNCGGRFVPKG